jgi:hypothetical protein
LFRFDGVRWIKIEDAVRMNMTNNDSRNTLKTSFINNSNFTYVDRINVDIVKLLEDDTVIETNIPFIEAPFVVLKLDAFTIEYVTADHEGLLEIYDTTKLKINLPEDDFIPISGPWSVSLYNHREAQRQSLSKALKPKADL